MRNAKRWMLRACGLTGALVLAGFRCGPETCFGASPFGTIVGYAMQMEHDASAEDGMTDEEILALYPDEALAEDASEEPNEALTADEEDGEDDLTNDEIEALMEEYMDELGIDADVRNDLDPESLQVQKVVEPPLTMTEEPSGGIRYTLPNGSFFLSSVPEGMITSQPVEIALSQNLAGVVKRDDDLEMLPDSWTFSEPGSYRVKILSYQLPEEADGFRAYEVNFHFTVIGQADGQIGAMPAPNGFRIEEVWLEGQQMEIENDRCYFFREDGRYVFRFTDTETGRMQVETAWTRDTQAPFLLFSQEIADGRAQVPLEFTPSEPGCKVRVGYNGEYGYTSEYALRYPGYYELTVEDSVGNSRVYQLDVRQVFKLLDVRLIGAGLVLLALTALRLIFLRNDMRVL